METKPYDLQSPEQIAKDYGGNLQKIAEAMQMGILDPTAGTLAGMFIKRMRAAAQQEGAPQQTVAQQVFAPPPPPQPPQPPAGLGATPQAAAMPPMGAPPPQGMPPQEMGPPPQGMPAMAEGGMVPPYASGGLTDLPIPDAMFDEPNNGGYAGGGMVAFATGAAVDADEDGDGNPDTYFGFNYKNPMANAARDAELYGVPETKYAKEYEADLLKRRSPEARKERNKENFDMALIKAGIAMANTPGSILQSATKGIGAALPGLEEAAKENRAEEREIQRGLIDLEQGRNTAAAQKAMRYMEMQKIGIQGREGQIGREFQRGEAEATRGFQREQNALDRAVQMFGYSQRGSGGSGGSGDGSGGTKPLSEAQTTERIGKLDKQMEKAEAAAKKYSKEGNFAAAERSLMEYGAARTARNALGAKAGLPALTGAPSNIKEYNEYVKRTGTHPSGRKPGEKIVKNGPTVTGGKVLPKGVGKDWTLMRDAKGNKAYVSPDGKQIIETR